MKRILFQILKFLIRNKIIPQSISYRLIIFIIHQKNDFEFVCNYQGIKYKGNFKSYIDCFIYFTNVYEEEMVWFLKENANRKLNFIDVGANCGAFALIMTRYFNSVHAFEPNPSLFNGVEENVRINQFNNIFLHNIGLGDKDEFLTYFQASEDNPNLGMGSFVNSNYDNLTPLENKLVVKNASKYFYDKDINNIGLIKIDVEGFERFVLSGLQQIIIENQCQIIMEWDHDTHLFLNEEKIKSLLPNYEIFKINKVKNKYKLEKFYFDVISGLNICLIPMK